MVIIPEPLEFDWDDGNIQKNLQKHGVSQQEAEEMFAAGPFPVPDPRHSKREMRYQALGETKKRRRLFAAFTVRNKRIRIISIRDMTTKEGQVYEEVKKHS